MHFVALELACAPCDRRGKETVLGTWSVDTDAIAFDANQVDDRGDNKARTIQELPERDGVRQRHKFVCPRCGHTPVFRAERIDEALRALFEAGVIGTRRHLI